MHLCLVLPPGQRTKGGTVRSQVDWPQQSHSPRDNNRPYDASIRNARVHDVLDLVSHNLQGSGDERLPNGTRANIKFEMIVDDMIDEKRDIFAVQETWLTGT